MDGTECGTIEIQFVMLIISSIGPSVGFGYGSPVSRRYASPNPFEGNLIRVDITIVPRTPPAEPGAANGSDGDQIAAANARQWMSRQWSRTNIVPAKFADRSS